MMVNIYEILHAITYSIYNYTFEAKKRQTPRVLCGRKTARFALTRPRLSSCVHWSRSGAGGGTSSHAFFNTYIARGGICDWAISQVCNPRQFFYFLCLFNLKFLFKPTFLCYKKVKLKSI